MNIQKQSKKSERWSEFLRLGHWHNNMIICRSKLSKVVYVSYGFIPAKLVYPHETSTSTYIVVPNCAGPGPAGSGGLCRVSK